MERKVAIIGAGFVSASIAYALTIRNLARKMVLIDIDSKKPRAKRLLYSMVSHILMLRQYTPVIIMAVRTKEC